VAGRDQASNEAPCRYAAIVRSTITGRQAGTTISSARAASLQQTTESPLRREQVIRSRDLWSVVPGDNSRGLAREWAVSPDVLNGAASQVARPSSGILNDNRHAFVQGELDA